MKKHIVHFLQTHKKLLYVVSFIVVLLVGLTYIPRCLHTKVCGNVFIEQMVRKEVSVTTPKGTLVVEVVDTPESREQGLSGRTGIEFNDGMLFTFPSAGRFGFWMKDMQFPIDIIWINKEGVIVHIVENAKPEDYPAKYVNAPEASYVLEIKANQARVYGMYLGVKLSISGQN